jgi:hypothetical protein
MDSGMRTENSSRPADKNCDIVAAPVIYCNNCLRTLRNGTVLWSKVVVLDEPLGADHFGDLSADNLIVGRISLSPTREKKNSRKGSSVCRPTLTHQPKLLGGMRWIR